MLKTRYSLRGLALSLLTAVLLAGCNDNDSNTNTQRSFSVEIKNLTTNQPFSPLAYIAHNTGYHAWVEGQAASIALEHLAEGGSSHELLAAAQADTAHLQSGALAAPLGAGNSVNVRINVDNASQARLSLVTMLVNTNDAYSGIDALDIGSLTLGETVVVRAPAWDAGSEANTETAGSIPGPADNGEGFNAARDDVLNAVTIHAGVISEDDGLLESVLNQSHRFDNPVAQFTITRTQ